MDLTSYEILAIAIGAFGVGFFKSNFSMAIGLVLVPVMILFWPTRFIIGIIAIHMFISDYAIIRLFWRQWEWRLVKIVIPGFYVGIIAGTAVLVSMSDFWVRKFIGTSCLVFIAIQIWKELRGEITPPRISAAGGAAIGIIGGIVSAIAHTGGTVLTIYLLSQGVEKVRLVATIIVTWMFVNPIKVTSYYAGGLMTPSILIAGLASFPFAFAGGWIGKKLLDRMSERVFSLSILALATATAARLLWE